MTPRTLTGDELSKFPEQLQSLFSIWSNTNSNLFATNRSAKVISRVKQSSEPSQQINMATNSSSSSSSRLGWKHENLGLKILLNSLTLVLLCQTLGAVAKSVQRLRVDDKDPMMALPSGRDEQQEVRFVTYQPAGPYAMAQAADLGNRQELMVDYQAQAQDQIVTEIQPEQQYEMMQVQPRANEPQGQAEDCNQRDELSALFDQRSESASVNAPGEQSISPEYAGQLVYVSQGGNEADRLKGAAASWSQAADLSATILTEIPVKDMPAEVLRKLRRDYGVKVVATRDRPGANLVINCDEYSGQENSICSRHLATHEAAHENAHQAHHPSERAQLETVEPLVGSLPRQAAAAFHHVEHVVQPTSEPNRVYVQENPTESYHQGEDSNAGHTEQSRPVQEGEQAVYEVATPATSQTSAYEGEQQENNKETTPLSQSAGQQQSDESHGDDQDEPTSYDQTNRSAPGRGHESHEQSGNQYGEQHNDHEAAHWRQNSPGEQTMRRTNSDDWQTPNGDYVKQVDSSETNSAAAHQTSR